MPVLEILLSLVFLIFIFSTLKGFPGNMGPPGKNGPEGLKVSRGIYRLVD